MPYIIGLTGNIACGKSTVLRWLRQLGADTIDADEEARQVMEPGEAVCRQVESAFGPEVVDSSSHIDRKKLARIVFTQPEKLARLERIVHPAVKSAIDQMVKESKAEVVVIDAIKLLESNMCARCDAIWVVTCRAEQQLDRLIRDRGMAQDVATMRINAQPPQQEKIARADVVIDNSGPVEATRQQVGKAWGKVMTRLRRD
ncbi:MAG: dephospho-CoA kinase [Chloroflexi bacterium]|nr:dephospho-CoA kinase [Chloroflexota bacterium]